MSFAVGLVFVLTETGQAKHQYCEDEAVSDDRPGSRAWQKCDDKRSHPAQHQTAQTEIDRGNGSGDMIKTPECTVGGS